MSNAILRMETYEREDGMPKGVRLSDEQRERIYTAFVMGQEVEDIAEQYGISEGHTRKVIRDQRKARESMSVHEKVVAGDKRNGRLMSTVDPHRYEGTCVISGKAKTRTFTAVNARNATDQWETWCQRLRDEDEFIARVERRSPAGESTLPEQETDSETVEQDVDVTPASVPDIDIRPWREVAEERLLEIEELKQRIAELESKTAPSDNVVAATEVSEPKLSRWFNDNGSFSVVWRDKPLYVIWASGDQPRLFGAYQRVDDALKKVDELNDIAAFLGNDKPFEVEEVEWR